jgi:ribosomal protein L20A (L18A)
MPKKREPKPDNPEQSKRFIETAKEVGADEDEEALERVFTKIASPKRVKQNHSD